MGYCADLKSKAKACLRNYYWAAVVVVLVVSLLGGEDWLGISQQTITSGSTNYNNTNELQERGSGAVLYEAVTGAENTRTRTRITTDNGVGSFGGFGILLTFIAGLIAIPLTVIGILFGVFISNPVTVGTCRFFMESREIQRSAGIGRVFYAFKSETYINVIKTMFIRNLYIFLWTLLLVIPGIIKSYQYYLVPYILSENPTMDYREALDRSRDMMDGNKWATFVLELSFIGWYLLVLLGLPLIGVISLAILPLATLNTIMVPLMFIGLLFLQPYIRATFAEMYAALRNNIDVMILNGFGDETYAETHN